MRITIIFAIHLLFLSACADKPLILEDWRAYLQDEENGLRKNKEWGGLELTLEYRPTDALVWQEYGFSDRIENKKMWDSLSAKYEDQVYFNLSIASNNNDLLTALGSQDPRYYEVLQGLSFKMEEYTGIITFCRDTITTLQANFFRNFDSTSTDILLVFENQHLLACNEFDIWVKNLGLNMPIQRFTFNSNDLRRTPRLLIKLKE